MTQRNFYKEYTARTKQDRQEEIFKIRKLTYTWKQVHEEIRRFSQIKKKLKETGFYIE